MEKVFKTNITWQEIITSVCEILSSGIDTIQSERSLPLFLSNSGKLLPDYMASHS
jgi:hypothetical protein